MIMRRSLPLMLILFLNGYLFAQNEPELVDSINGGNSQAIKTIYLDHGLPKILLNNGEGVEIYNMDLSLYTSFDYPAIDTANYIRAYFTRSLFDCDTTNVEYIAGSGSFGNSVIRVFREDGTILLELENYQLPANSLVDNNELIVSDEEGSYISFMPGAIEPMPHLVYKFCGQVPQALPRESDGTILSGFGIIEQGAGFSAYPNPASERIKFEYDLEGHNRANLFIFDSSGRLVKELMLGQAFDFLYLDISDLEHGTYVARIVTEDGFELTEKFVKVD